MPDGLDPAALLMAPDRAEADGAPPHPRGGRGVLQDLDDLVAVHDRAGCDTEVLPDGEGAAVGLRGHAAVVPDIGEELAQPPEEAGSPAVEGPLECGRIAGQRVGRRQGAGQHAQREARPLDVVPVLRGRLVLVDEPIEL